MRVAVTGGLGRLGGEAVKMLRQAGHEVLVVDVRPPADGTAGETRVADLTVYDGLTDLFAGCEAIVHLGNAPATRQLGRAKGYANNTLSNYNVFAAADELKIKCIVNASSVQAYGCCSGASGPGDTYSMPRYFPLDEDHPLLPADAYPLSKANSEWILESFIRRRGDLTAWSLRFVSVLTDEASMRPPQKASDRHKEESPGQWFRDSLQSWVHVEDAARAILLCCQTHRPGHTALNVTSPHSRRLWTPEQIIEAYGHLPEFKRPVLPGESLVCPRKAERLIGFVAMCERHDDAQKAA